MKHEDLKTFLQEYRKNRTDSTRRLDEPENIDHVPVDDMVGMYFRQMSTEPLLTADQEIALSKRIERGREASRFLEEEATLTGEQESLLEEIAADGQAARRRMARANTRLVVSIAKRYHGHGLPLSDLIQEGNVGLMIAIDKFDYTMGNRFSTYASWWIRQTITRGLSKKARIIRLPINKSTRLRQINAARAALKQELGHDPTNEEIAERLDMKASEVRSAVESIPYTVALEKEGHNDTEFGAFLEDGASPNPEEVIDTLALKQVIQYVLGKLMPRERRVLQMRYGLEGDDPMTLQQVADQFDLSRERIRQIQMKALQQLRHPENARMLNVLLA
ncbi:MAG: sigma-70 family RNA polymerase sigma factor [Anaerolineae bacterium]|nr:sigma-70 family RNA polymerase sigma factor [Anaerolineae bacterium]